MPSILLKQIVKAKVAYCRDITREETISSVLLCYGLLEGRWGRERQRNRWLDYIMNWARIKEVRFGLAWAETER